MDCRSFFKTLWTIIEKVLPWVIIVLVITFGFRSCNDSRRYTEQLDSIQSTTDDLKQSIDDIGAGLGRQESIITELRDCQSILESTIDDINSTVQSTNNNLNELIGNEQRVDGSVGAIRGTVRQLESTVNLTIRGIEETGIE